MSTTTVATAKPAPLAIAYRGELPESCHYGSIAVVDAAGRCIARAGAPQSLTWSRSTCKPLQAMPLVGHPDFARLGWSAPELAMICASHSGQRVHTRRVARMLKQIGCGVNDLACGVHAPYWIESLGADPQPLTHFSALHNNCSGKHTGMLACCQLMGIDERGYLHADHPLQQAIAQAVSHWTDVPVSALGVGIDGCSAPNFAMPLQALALAYARLVTRNEDMRYGPAPKLIAQAMVHHPLLVAGQRRLDARLMRAGRGAWLSMIGAEGVCCLGVFDKGWGIAIKIADGAERAVRVVVVETLRQLALLDRTALDDLADIAIGTLRNCNGIPVGSVRPVFSLECL
jgi:L-asparaginase II